MRPNCPQHGAHQKHDAPLLQLNALLCAHVQCVDFQAKSTAQRAARA